MPKRQVVLQEKRYFSSDPAFPFDIQRVKQGYHLFHKHEFLELVYVWGGKAVHCINEETIDIKQGDVFLLDRNDRHKYKDTKNLEIVNILFSPLLLGNQTARKEEFKRFFDFAFLKPLFKETGRHLHLSGITDFKVKVLVEEMLVEFQNRSAWFRGIIKNDLANLLIILGRAYEKELAESEEMREEIKFQRRKFEEALHYIDENYTRQISLAEVAGIACFHPNYFSEIFHKTTGKSFCNYLNDLRMHHAVLLLKNTQLHVEPISRQCGFASYRYFGRAFKKVFGLAPSEYREKATKS